MHVRKEVRQPESIMYYVSEWKKERRNRVRLRSDIMRRKRGT